MTETFSSGGTTIRMEAHAAPAASSEQRPALLLLHGAGGNTAFWLDRLAPHLNAAGVSLFAPHYFDRTGTDRADFATIGDGVHVPQWLDTIATAYAVVASRPGVDPQRIALVGVSLGAYLSLALAATRSAAATLPSIRCIVELSGGLVEPYASQATSSFPPTLIVHGESDDIVPVQNALDLEARLSSLGVPHEMALIRNEGHWFSAAAQLQLLMTVGAFLRKHL
jgi:carboxymethylenebutenolidase